MKIQVSNKMALVKGKSLLHKFSGFIAWNENSYSSKNSEHSTDQPKN